MSDCNDEDEYQYHESPCSHDTGIADESLDGLIEMMEWAEIEGMRTLRTTREGANFTRYGELWVVPVYGGQPIHHDRHILDQEEGSSHTWNLVCSGDGDQGARHRDRAGHVQPHVTVTRTIHLPEHTQQTPRHEEHRQGSLCAPADAVSRRGRRGSSLGNHDRRMEKHSRRWRRRSDHILMQQGSREERRPPG